MFGSTAGPGKVTAGWRHSSFQRKGRSSKLALNRTARSHAEKMIGGLVVCCVNCISSVTFGRAIGTGANTGAVLCEGGSGFKPLLWCWLLKRLSPISNFADQVIDCCRLLRSPRTEQRVGTLWFNDGCKGGKYVHKPSQLLISKSQSRKIITTKKTFKSKVVMSLLYKTQALPTF